MQIDLEGEQLFVSFEVNEKSCTNYSRGDHGMGGGEYKRYYWSGLVTVTTQNNSRLLAVCRCHRRDWPHEKDVNKLIFSPFILSGKERQYADLVGNEIVKLFQDHRGREAPCFDLQPLDQEVLIGAGIAVDAHEQLYTPIFRG